MIRAVRRDRRVSTLQGCQAIPHLLCVRMVDLVKDRERIVPYLAGCAAVVGRERDVREPGQCLGPGVAVTQFHINLQGLLVVTGCGGEIAEPLVDEPETVPDACQLGTLAQTLAQSQSLLEVIC